MWLFELLSALFELVEFADLITLILRGIWALGMGLVCLARWLGQTLLQGAWWLLHFGR